MSKKINKQKKTEKKRLVTKEKQARIDRRKTTFFMILFVIIFVLIFITALLWTFKIQVTHVFHGTNLEDYAEQMYTKQKTVEANRGNIFDVNGEPLAVNIKTYDMAVVLNNGEEGKKLSSKQKDEVYDIIIDDLGLSKDKDAKKLIRDQLDHDNSDGYTQVEIGIYGTDITIDEKDKLENDAKKAKLDWVFSFDENIERYYPFGDFASYVLGFSMKDENGNDNPQIGIESLLNGYLAGKNGKQEYLSDSNNIPINDAQSSVMEKVDGSDVTLTLDTQVQQYIQTFMDKYLKKIGEEMAFTIVMDANDGSILGAYSTPSFDPNKRDVENYINPFSEYCFEPGSTIKSFVIATAMETGVWNPKNTDDSGKRTDKSWGDGAYVADWLYNEYQQSWGRITWEQGFWYSANTIMTHIVDEIGFSEWNSYLTDTFEFGKPVTSQLMNTSACTVNPKYPLDYANTSFGQGMTANALQLLRGYSAFATDGEMLQPHIVEKMTDSETGEDFYTAETDDTLDAKEVISKETAKKVRHELKQAVYYKDPSNRAIYDGVAEPYSIGETKIGAKTGTAQIASNDGSGYAEDGDYVYSVMALAPIDDPEILLYTAVVAPKKSATDAMGNYVTKIIDYTVNHIEKTSKQVDLSNLSNNRYELENMKGKTVVDAKKALEDDGINVIALGNGDVVSQYPKSQVISKDDTVVLRGVGDVDYNILEEKSYNEAAGICKVLNWECTYSGMGFVTKVEKTSETKYKLTLEVPEKIKSKTEEKDDKS